MDRIAAVFPKRNAFDLSHERKLSCTMGILYPVMLEEVVPGDTFKVNVDFLLRFAPMLRPMMHRVNVKFEWFFVPIRLIWTDFEDFITGGEQGDDASVPPYIEDHSTIPIGDLRDYFGLPTGTAPGTFRYSSLPFRAYDLIWNKWYRDQNFQSEVVFSKASGEDSTTNFGLLKRNWEKDYFTCALPWAQRGNPVVISLAGTAPVTMTDDQDATVYAETLAGALDAVIKDASNTNAFHVTNSEGSERAVVARITDSITGSADLSSVSVVSINDMRRLFQIQKWMERSARGGSRYVESILSHFGVISSDARLQNPELLGADRRGVIVSEVIQTSESGSTPQGNLAGHGFSAGSMRGFKKSFNEHGYIIGLMSIMPRTAYQNGVSRLWTRETRYDWLWPEFAHLGEQAILNQEIFVSGVRGTGSGQDQEVWGYQERYSEFRRRESSVHGDFRNPVGLGVWHMGRIFNTLPELDATFMECNPQYRPFVAPTVDTCYVQLVNNVIAVRPLPLVGEPGLIDH